MAIGETRTLKSLGLKMKEEGEMKNKGGGESSFRVLYYGDASAGSVPFMWESQPGTPKQPTIDISLPPLTPPPAFYQFKQTYNSSKHTTSLRTLFLFTKTHSPEGPPSPTSESFISYNSLLSSQSTSLHSLFLASTSTRTPSFASLPHSSPTTPMNKGHGKMGFRWCQKAVGVGGGGGGGGGSSTETMCFGGGFKHAYGMKKVKSALMSIGSYGKIHSN